VEAAASFAAWDDEDDYVQSAYTPAHYFELGIYKKIGMNWNYTKQ
jgi:hypothetical protein